MAFHYLGQKCENVEFLLVDNTDGNRDEHPIPAMKASLEEPLIKAMANMKKLKDHQFKIHPLTKGVTAATGSHKLSTNALKEIRLCVANNNYQEQLNVIEDSTTICNSLTNLELWQRSTHHDIKDPDNRVDDGLYSHAIVKACKQMPNLYMLHIFCDMNLQYYEPHLLATMLQSVLHIKKLKIGTIAIDKDIHPTFWKALTTKDALSEQQQLRALDIDIGYYDSISNFGVYNFDAANRFLKFVLQFCPLLEEFAIMGTIQNEALDGDDGALRFDFSHLKHLKSVKMVIEGESQYKVNVSRMDNRIRRHFGTAPVLYLNNENDASLPKESKPFVLI